MQHNGDRVAGKPRFGLAVTRKQREPNQFNVGEWVERAAWCDLLGQVPNACRELAKEFGRLETKYKVRFGPLKHEILPGDHQRVSRPRGGKFAVLLYAQVKKVRDTEIVDVSWVHGLRPDDLARHRAATKAAFARAKPHAPPIRDCDANLIIGMKGPEVARKMLEKKLFEIGGKVLNVANDMAIGD